MAAGTLTVAATAMISFLSWLEHERAVRPSLLLCNYLLVTVLFDITQSRTLLLRPESINIGKVFVSTVGIKVILLLLEALPKLRCLRKPTQVYTAENTSGPFSLSMFYWITDLIVQGNRKILSLDDLLPLDYSLSATVQFPAFERAWQSSNHHASMRFLLSLSKAMGFRMVYPVLPRIAMIGFSFCQPFLIQGISQYLQQQPDTVSANFGYGWIGATFFTYIGLAVSSSIYWYLQNRFLAVIRADVVAGIFRHTVNLNLSHSSKSDTLTLMSTDVERLKFSFQFIHEIWANAVEVALAAWLLQRKIGAAFLIALAVVMVCGLTSVALGKYAGERQKLWMEATQTRVSSISSIIASMKSLKMLGITSQLTGSAQGQRIQELRAGNRFRTITVFSSVMGIFPLFLIPVLTFAATSRVLDTSRIFTSLAYILLLSTPLTQLFQLLPQIIAARTCFDRVAQFLEREAYTDSRKISTCEPPDETKLSLSKSENTFVSVEASFGWESDKTTLRNITLHIPFSKVTLIVGPVGSGKSTLCKALLGELRPTAGTIFIRREIKHVAFCDQTPWLPNGTVRDCIVGHSNMDEDWYHTVLRVTELQYDLSQLSAGDSTVIGSSGISLSGGQKLRLALARALFSRAELVVLDDCFSGLDNTTEAKISENLLSSQGVLRSVGTTVILVTHNAKHLHTADHIIALGSDGQVIEEGSLSDLLENDQYVAGLTLGRMQEESSSTNPKVNHSRDKPLTEGPSYPQLQLDGRARQLGDIAVFRYFFSLFGSLYMVYFALSCVAFSFFYNFSTVWLKFWSDDNNVNPNNRRGFYLGIFALIQILSTLTFYLFVQHTVMNMAVRSGQLLHFKALSTVVSARLSFFSSTDAGTTVNRFSQDMTIIDGELTYGVSNTTLVSAASVGQAVVIAVASPYVAACYPFLLAIFYVLQRVYLRTSRQLRFLDLEAKSPL